MQLAQQYAASPAAARTTYDGTLVTITGKTAGFAELNGVPTLLLEGDSGLEVACGFPASLRAQAKSVKKGQTVTVKGRCSGRANKRIAVGRCQFVK